LHSVCLACKIPPKTVHWGDLFVSDIHVRRSVVTSAVDRHCEILWIFFFLPLYTSTRW